MTRSISTSSINAAAAKTATNASGAPLLNLKFNTPVDSIVNKPVYMAIVPAVTGQMGILADHVKSMAQLKPGVVSLYGNDGNDLIGRYFVSGGFAKIDPEGTSISVADAVKLEDLDLAAAKKALELATANLAKSTSEVEKAEISIQAECLEAIISAIETKQ